MDEPFKLPDQRIPSLGCGILIAAALALAACLAWSSWRTSNRAKNEVNASSALKVLSSAEADFRANDRDGNGVQDFWTADVAGLYRFGLIDRELAEADVEPFFPLVPKPVPYKGYYFRTLDADDSELSAGTYRQDTDRKSGKVHNLSKFGFVAFPAESGMTGKYIHIVNENNSVPRCDASRPVPRNWPSDNDLKQFWSKVQ